MRSLRFLCGRRTRRPLFSRPRLEVLEDRTLLSVCMVDRFSDTGDGSGLTGDLRYCITNTASGDTINFSVEGTINLTRALPNLTRGISIEGPGPDLVTVRRGTGGAYPVFTVASGANVSISELTITNGNGVNGGGIENRGMLTISNSIISGNTSAGGGSFAGGIYNTGTMTVSNSTISGNTSGTGGGGGAIFNENGTMTVSNSTISGNTAAGGGGIYNNGTMTLSSSTISGNRGAADGGNGGGGIFNNGPLTVINSTISGNTALGGSFGGGGIFNHTGTLTISNSTIIGNSTTTRGGGILDGTGRIAVRNTIIAGNTAPAGPDVFGAFGSQGHNLVGNDSGGSGFDATDLRNVNPNLGTLQDNGGPTWTRALLPGSPAIDAGDNTDAPDWDQRGEGFPRIVNGVIDIGAFEYLSVCTVDRFGDLDEGQAGRGSLRYCVIESLFRADTIDFEVEGVINLTRALPNLTRSVSIEGPGADLLTVRRDLGGYYRIFTVATGVRVGISGLKIINGHGYASPGGGIDNFGILTVSNSIISDNFASGNGGGGIFNSGTLTVSSSTISSNTTGGGPDGGGVFNSGTLTVSNSTISGNSGGGGGSRGGGIFNSGLLSVSNSTISGNMTDSTSTSGGNGAGIFNNSNGTVTLTNSTISGNSAGGNGGGGIFNSGTLTVSNSTISGNTSICGGCVGTLTRNGGGIFNDGPLTVSNSTIAGNSAPRNGGGIYVGRAMAVRNTVIAGNTANLGPDVFGNLGSQGHNLLGNPQEASGWVETDILHVNPRLGPLQDNGGPTWTRALLPGSPAIDAGDNTDAPDWDQRGEGFPRIVNDVIDIGAFEYQGE